MTTDDAFRAWIEAIDVHELERTETVDGLYAALLVAWRAGYAAGQCRLDPIEGRVWCDTCTGYTARVTAHDDHGDEIIHCPTCRTTWAHP